MAKPKLYLLVGNIGSGKSTYARKMAKKGFVVVSRDALRYMVGAGNYVFNPNLEPAIKQANIEIMKIFMQNHFNIISDQSNLNFAMRAGTLMMANIYGYEKIAIVFPKYSQRVSVNRRLKHPHGNFPCEVWNKVWAVFNLTMEEPTKAEGFDKIIKVRAK